MHAPTRDLLRMANQLTEKCNICYTISNYRCLLHFMIYFRFVHVFHLRHIFSAVFLDLRTPCLVLYRINKIFFLCFVSKSGCIRIHFRVVLLLIFVASIAYTFYANISMRSHPSRRTSLPSNFLELYLSIDGSHYSGTYSMLYCRCRCCCCLAHCLLAFYIFAHELPTTSEQTNRETAVHWTKDNDSGFSRC